MFPLCHQDRFQAVGLSFCIVTVSSYSWPLWVLFQNVTYAAGMGTMMSSYQVQLWNWCIVNLFLLKYSRKKTQTVTPFWMWLLKKCYMEKGQRAASDGFLFHKDTGEYLTSADALICNKFQGW